MKKIQILILLFFLTLPSIAQIKTTKTYYSNGKTKSINYILADNFERIILFYPNGKPDKEINLKDSKTFGSQILYDSSGKKITESFVIGIDQILYNLINDTVTNDNLVDVISSKETNYFSNGKKKSEGYYINGCKAGRWIYYNIDGTINETKFYKTLKIHE